MTNTKPHWTPDELADICAKATGLYYTIVGLTETPREAAEITAMIHMLLFLNHGDGATTCDQMLADYSHNFKANWEAQVAHDKGQMN